ncbi:3a9f4633-9ce2-491a-8bf4-90a08c909d6c [Sclerotinia trifoliorum]|uniref:3a9f4633-9ce2-491a-8bf4-90a08c909d6c n=1 Tax=Sclerotinia trifoliorum TaxID=28548 RepID=A0A8H2VUI4_9HELO|nr:3a9f4633-9ce2-491a-8bf4-90a08c909d6c [Sclerotinia trifoliorum]
MSLSHDQNATMTTTATANVTIQHSPEKSAEKKAQASLTLDKYLYAAPPNMIERLSQGVTTSKKEFRAQVKKSIVAFDEAFEEKK